jgi:predicted phosphodiesterase
MAALERILIVPDTHVPYHDRRATDLVLQVGEAWKPDRLLHNGDLGDFYEISDYVKDPTRAYDFDAEVEECRAFRAQLDALGAKRKDITLGNHEDRLPRYLKKQAPKLFSQVTADKLLELSANGWNVTPYEDSLRIGKVHFTHAGSSNGRYSTARALDEFQESVVVGHNHAQMWLVEGDALGNHHVGAQFGWLGDEKYVDYTKRVKVRRKWSLGFGLGYHNKSTGTIYLVPCPIVKYRCMVEGVEYRG